MLYLLIIKTAQLYVTGIALLLIEKYAEYFSIGGVDYGDGNLYQHAIFLGEYLYVTQYYSGIATTHTLYFCSDVLLQLFQLIFKQKLPDHCAISWTARQLTLTNVECIQQVSLNQCKISQSEFFVLIDGVEADKCGHNNIYGLPAPGSAQVG